MRSPDPFIQRAIDRKTAGGDNVKRDALAGKDQPSRAADIRYRAYTREFEGGTALFITATCSYPVSPYEIYFQEAGLRWTLMEKAPDVYFPETTYKIASTTPGLALVRTPETVTVIDGYGPHKVPVEKCHESPAESFDTRGSFPSQYPIVCPLFDLDGTIPASSITEVQRESRGRPMKTCPVCNDSFSDELNFCDIDGTRLNRAAGEAVGQDRRNWWSLLGAGLLVGAVVISAASIIFLPKARVSNPVVNSEPQSLPAPPKAASSDNATAVASAATEASAEPDTSAADAVAPEPKRKDKSSANSNAGVAAPNPKAAALAAEGVDTSAAARDANKNAASSKPEAPIAAKPVSDTHPAENATKPTPAPAEVKKDSKTTAVSTKVPEKSSDKKKSDDKDKKKGGFLRVFKKIFGKD